MTEINDDFATVGEHYTLGRVQLFILHYVYNEIYQKNYFHIELENGL